MKTTTIAAGLILVVGLSLSASAQTGTPGINGRQLKQQQRIREGVKSGELTRKEARRLEMQQGKIQADKMVAKSDGKVTPAERKHLQREENRASRNIYRKKHNAVKPR